MPDDVQNAERIRHINGFVDAFINRNKRDRYRSFLLDSRRRREITNYLNHKTVGDLIPKYFLNDPPYFKPASMAYLISGESELDDTFAVAKDAIDLVRYSYSGTIASIIPGMLAVLKEEPPASIVWLYKPLSK